MKKMNKKGFTLVEIMIVVAIIGLLAAIGIPSILGAYANAQTNAKARNVAEVEKAKGVLTLPTQSGITGAMALTAADAFSTASTNLLAALRIGDLSELTVGGTAITVGDLTTKASY
jgi:type IV pilus assembly protein PilA